LAHEPWIGGFELAGNRKAEKGRFNADVAQSLIPAGKAAVAPRTGRD
jgi:hypothetical protein